MYLNSLREPPPNGIIESFMSFVGAAHLDGSNLSGSGNTDGSLCRLYGWVQTVEPPGRKLPAKSAPS